MRIPLAIATALLMLALGGCSKEAPDEAPPENPQQEAPTPAPAEPEPLPAADAVPTPGTTPEDGPDVVALPVDIVVSLTDAATPPSPTDATPEEQAPEVLSADAAKAPAVDADASKKVFDEFKSLLEKGQIEKSADLLDAWVKRSPMDLVNRRNLIHVLLKTNQVERAIPHMRFMAAEAEDKAEWLAHLGRALASLGEYAEAVRVLEEALELNPGDVDLALDLGRTHATRKDWDKARRVFEKALDLGRKQADILRELSAVLVELGEYNEAFKRYRELQRLEPAYETALTMAKIASQYERCDDVVDSLANWEKDFADETPHLLLAACAMKADENVKAQKHLLLGIKANEKCFYCALWLGDIYFEAMDWDGAVKYYAMAAPINPKDYRPFHQLGKALANADKHIEAARALVKADERKPRDPEILYALGMELVRAGQKAEAWDVWGRLEPLDRARADEIKALLTQ
jgi:tetratricopeptide (TPR) repeat protein